jgi:chemotaxis protein MotA
MDLGTIFGLGLGGGMILITIVLSGQVGLFISIPSVLTVIFGSFGALLVANPLKRVLGIMKYANHALRVPNFEEEMIISQLVTFSEKARREGLLALEDDLEEVGDQFLRNGIQLVVDGTDPEVIRNILYNEVNQIQARHAVGIKVFDDWGKYAPAFGMIGTLMGLIQMLGNIEDKSAIGIGMALALITTLYGAILANLVLIPMAAKLEDRDRDEVLVKEIMIEGILSIQQGDNPRILEQKLTAFVEPERRHAVSQESAAE